MARMNTELIERQLKLMHELPDNFEFYKFAHVQDKPPMTQFTGGLSRRLKSGKHRGMKTWDGRDKTQDRTFYVTNEQYAEMERQYTEETGNCPKCLGKKVQFERWQRLDEESSLTTYRTCGACNGVGKVLQESQA
jgi:DNA-directed RNA polymerase subunit M/transcription elongation factor TFIIS